MTLRRLVSCSWTWKGGILLELFPSPPAVYLWVWAVFESRQDDPGREKKKKKKLTASVIVYQIVVSFLNMPAITSFSESSDSCFSAFYPVYTIVFSGRESQDRMCLFHLACSQNLTDSLTFYRLGVGKYPKLLDLISQICLHIFVILVPLLLWKWCYFDCCILIV